MNKKRVNNKSTGRDYRKEYDEYQGTEEQKKRRVVRNRDRRKAERDGRVSKGDGMDIHHRDDKNLKKPVIRNRSKNRGDKR